jgi:hypothetical protein
MSKRQFTLQHLLGLAAALTGAVLPPTIARADVTETKTSTLNMSITKINSTDTERYSGDKKRTDSETRCEGFLMSRLCGDIKGGEIIRLDKDLTWTLEPAKKEYVEKPFPTPGQRAEARQKAEEMMAKLKSCPAPTPQPSAPDTSKCDMSPPKFEVKQTDETGFFAGHQARRSTVTMTQTCTNKQTGDACDIIVGVDSWLTQDEIPGIGDARAFREAYAKKLGLDQTAQAMKPQMQTLLAPYVDALRQAGGKSGDFKGYPLKTSITIAMGGEHCAAAKAQPPGVSGGGSVANATEAAQGAAENSTTSAAGSAAAQAAGQSAGGGIGGAIAGSAAGAFGSKLMGGLFAKKTPPPPKPDASATPAGQADKPAPLVEWTIETTSIGTDPIAGNQFELPAGWKQNQPKPQKERQFECPTPGK